MMPTPKSSSPALRLEIIEGNIGQVTFDQPGSRANTLSLAVLAELQALAGELQKRTDLRGLLLRSGKPGMFIAGADLHELGKASGDPKQSQAIVQLGLGVVAGFESLPFPTVAAIEGACMGGGLELALGFDFRIAATHPKTDIGLPEVKVGLIPGWGGTQRLSRVIGPALASELICAGETVKPERARELRLAFDAVPSERLVEDSIRLLRWAGDSGAWRDARKQKQQPVGLSEEEYSFMFAAAYGAVREKTKGQLPAPEAALRAIFKGCNLPLEKGLQVETAEFLPLVGSTISRNLISIFFMTQRLQKDTGVADASVQPRQVARVGVLGAGIMGAGIAGANIRRGVSVVLTDSIPQAIEKGVAGIAKTLQSRVAIGRAKPEEVVTALALLSSTGSLAAMSDRDVVIEAIIENEEAKVPAYQELQKYMSADAILASNTSTISITRMGRSVRNPANFAGLHFFNPVDRMQLVEVIRGEKTSDATVATLVALAKKIGKTPIVVRDCPGFLVNRILFPYLNESLVMLEEGASPRVLDKAATTFGMPMGPVTLNDLVGLDTSLYAGRVINTAFAERATSSRILDELVKAGRLGQKTGAGFYSYAKSSQPDPRWRGDDRPAHAADAHGGQPHPDGRHRARSRRRRHGAYPGYRIPSVPRRLASLGRHRGPGGDQQETGALFQAGTAFSSDRADEAACGGRQGVLLIRRAADVHSPS
jgi:3-hydroxyacyl-CoA dehydrogenase/enoyl-CoA hydratase/3-hydroxybutyryl-CoA epimerase/3-hydroxyacyl-CoA dehydrogenase/enoyl-CoA hydratase/3-hydroxybutyryl-CoA epimerase/enoyl-CoA isomerase